MARPIYRKLRVPLILISLLTISLYLSGKNGKNYINPYFFGAKNDIAQIPSTKPNEQIQTYLEEEVAKLPGDYGVYIKDLKRQTAYSVNADTQFQTASIYKLAVMYKTYDALSRGELKKEDVLSEDEYTLDQILAPEDANQTDAVITYSVENALKTMITVSDNYSALLLARELGWQNINDFLIQQNITGFDLVYQEHPQATARATGEILEKIYNNTAVSYQSSEEMKTLLLSQTVNDKIPKYFPSDIKIAHKTGELDNIRNDAAIIYGKNSTYILVILSEAPIPEESTENIAQLSKNMYDKLEAK